MTLRAYNDPALIAEFMEKREQIHADFKTSAQGWVDYQRLAKLMKELSEEFGRRTRTPRKEDLV